MRAAVNPTDPPAVPNARRTAALVFIFITVVLDVLALGIIVPVLPGLVRGFLGGDTARGAEIYGAFGTVWAAMQFGFAPVLGALSDRFGRRPVILLSNFGLGLDYVLMALAPNLGWLFVGRVISGVTSASFPTAGAYIADVTPPEKRAAGYGMLGAAFGIGFVRSTAPSGPSPPLARRPASASASSTGAAAPSAGARGRPTVSSTPCPPVPSAATCASPNRARPSPRSMATPLPPTST